MVLLENKTDLVKYLNALKNIWLESDDRFPDFLCAVSKEVQAENEQDIRTFTEDFQKLIKSFPRLPFGRRKWKKKMFSLTEDFLCHETILGAHRYMDRLMIDSFQEELKEFLRHVRSFAPELSLEEIGQAIRNYIVYAMFREIHQVKSGFSLAGFGYSMLYPVTDNYIDSKTFSVPEKQEYNRIIRDKIEGKQVFPKTVHQQKTCDLLQAIESEYPREADTTIFHLLLMMLDAQELSLRQQYKQDRHGDTDGSNTAEVLSAEERLDISLYKGGMSVLIDRFFVRKELTEADMMFYLGLGFFLQLADDLQDIKDDSVHGYQTLFTLDLSSEHEEKLVNKMFHFIHQIMKAYRAENDHFKDFILSNCYQLVFTSVTGSREFFSESYLAEIEPFFPVTYPYFEDLKKNMADTKDSKAEEKYMKIMDEMIIK